MSKKHLTKQSIEIIKSILEKEIVKDFKKLDIQLLPESNSLLLTPKNNIADIYFSKKDNTKESREK